MPTETDPMLAQLAQLQSLPTPFEGLFDGRERLFWLYLLGSALIALVLMLAAGNWPSRARIRAYWLSRDARLDALYFLVAWGLRTALIIPLVLSVQTVAVWVLHALNATFEPPFLAWAYRDIVLAYTLALFLLSDFTRYWLHRLMHRSRWLWPFHRVHHAAKVLTPLLVYRIHPLESLLFALRHAAVAGAVTGVFIFLFGARLDLFTIFGENLFIVALFAFTANLRHSHVRLSYGRWLEHILVSPAQHQIHHDRRHLNTNFGSCLALWDWMFGTLKLPLETQGAPDYGIGPRGTRYSSVSALLLEPFRDLGRLIRRS
ncbi:sterol desaturase family protein [Rhodalgimonas zhirmunskyi]|uniref:Sterol desaturase family protein n=1 Tax=Rhodalgimonas zhirmunskyi TaxID=2964767 RepID=A0AAJ1U4U1_9RHOB|nr:sterol desaturase family protein [Rhodoalgimonas zhirmunskyi]MDQ2093715.1 sterol desaturase family protein [Rhodoalgimonas zhirmunskyi]